MRLARSAAGAADGLYEHPPIDVRGGAMTRHYCWHCYAQNPAATGWCVRCGNRIEAPAEISYADRLIWALHHPLPGRQMMAAQILGERRERSAVLPLRELVNHADPSLAAQALQSLVLIVGVDGARDLLEPLAASGPPAVANVAARALMAQR
jgi:HEAT repeats